MNRRSFTKLSALSSLAPFARLVPSFAQLKKAVLITMLPKEMSYLDRFKLAIDVGFEGLEAQTVSDPKIADEIKDAADKAKLRIHSVMNMITGDIPSRAAILR